MRKLFLCGILVWSGMILSAAKIALVPTTPELAPLADQVLAAMATEPGVEFVERTEIAKILAERKLTAAGLTGENIIAFDQTFPADLFAVITARPTKTGAAASGLIVYSARSGFRLINTNLPNVDTVNVIVEHLRQAVNTFAHPDKQLWLSVAAVRDVGIPERFKYRAAYIAAELERRLGGIPGVMVMERDNLGSVNQERELTGQMFKLAPSARLVRLEFSPGETVATAELKLRLTNAAGHELFRWQKSDCFADEKATMMQGLTALAGYLQVVMPELVSSEAEAARFYAEYQFLIRLGDYAAARRKLESAIALNPGRQNYRLQVLKLNRAEGHDGSVGDAIAALERNLATARSIEEEFPRLKGYYSHDYFDWEFTNKYFSLTSSDLTKLAELTSIYRPKNLAWIRQRYYNFDLTDGIGSLDEWNKYNRYCLDAGRFSLYWDAERWCEANYQTALKNLELSRKFFSQHPEAVGKDAAADWLFALVMQYVEANNNQDSHVAKEITQAVEKMLRNSEDYIERAANHPLSSVPLCALNLDLLRKTILSNYNEAEFKKNFQTYCQQQQQLLRGNKSPGGQDDYLILSFLRKKHSSLEKIMVEVRRQEPSPMASPTVSTTSKEPRLDEAPPVNIQTLANQLKREPTPEKKAAWALATEPQWRQCESLSFTAPEARDFFLELNTLVRQFGWRSNAPVFRKLEAAINHGVIIEKLSTVDADRAGSGGSSQTAIKNVVADGNRLFLLLKRERMVSNKGKYMRVGNCRIVTADIATGQLLSVTGWSADRQLPARISSELFLPPLAVGDDMAATGEEELIRLFDLKTGTSSEIMDVPGKQIMALAIMAGRIYAFVGTVKDNTARETILFSCRPDGSDRRIHLSTSRDDKQCELERAKPFIVYSMLTDVAEKRLIFNATSPNNSGTVNGLWDFVPDSGKAQCLFERKWRDVDPIMSMKGNQVFFSFFQEDFCVYDLRTGKGEIFFSMANAKAKNHLKVKFRAAQGIFYRGPFFARPDQIWFGGDCEVKLLTLPDVNRSPLIVMPSQNLIMNNSYLLFPHSDGRSAIAVDSRNIYKITPK